MQVSRSPGGDDGRLWPLDADAAVLRAPKRPREGGDGDTLPAEAAPEAEQRRESARCGSCRPCRLERNTPCAAAVVRRAAAAGHVGSALTLEGAAAIGRCVSVFWPAEREFFPGRLVAFNPLEPAFLVLYADGEWHWEALRSALVHVLPATHKAPRPPPMPRAQQQRLQAAARRGHTGASLALLGQGAVGYVLEVAEDRPGRTGWLRAQVVAFEPRTHAHLLFYPADAGEEWARLERTTVRHAPPALAAAARHALPPEEAAAAALGLGDDWADDALLSCLYGGPADDALLLDVPPPLV